MNNQLLTTLETIHGIDISFSVRTGVQGSKDVLSTGADFRYSPSLVALCEELQRLFDLTPVGSFIDDPTYGIKWNIGEALDPRVHVALTRLACLRALRHPSFISRFQVKRLDAWWDSESPNAIYVKGTLEVYGFENIQLLNFGPFALKYLLLGQTRDYGT